MSAAAFVGPLSFVVSFLPEIYLSIYLYLSGASATALGGSLALARPDPQLVAAATVITLNLVEV